MVNLFISIKLFFFPDALRYLQTTYCSFWQCTSHECPSRGTTHFCRGYSFRNLRLDKEKEFFKLTMNVRAHSHATYTIPPTRFPPKYFAWGLCPFGIYATFSNLSQEFTEITTRSLVGRNTAFKWCNPSQPILKCFIPLMPVK